MRLNMNGDLNSWLSNTNYNVLPIAPQQPLQSSQAILSSHDDQVVAAPHGRVRGWIEDHGAFAAADGHHDDAEFAADLHFADGLGNHPAGWRHRNLLDGDVFA